jgi:hypothetical protein
MLRFKQFTGTAPGLEQEVNRWLEHFEPDISQMTQTVSTNGAVVVSFLYEESFRGNELRIDEERGTNSVGATVSPDSIPDKPIPVPPEPGQYSPEIEAQERS